MVLSGPHSELIYHVDIAYEVGLALGSLLCIRAVW